MLFKVINCNVWIGGKLFDELLSFLSKEKADILLLQEVYNGDASFKERQLRTLSELQAKLQYNYSAFAPAFFERVDGKKLEQGNAIFSKYPLQEKQTIFFDVEYQERDPLDTTKYHITPRNLQHVVTEINSELVHVFNTQGIWGTHGEDTKRRIHMAQTIVDSLPEEKEKIILAGDFNVNENTRAISIIEERLVNVFKGQLSSSFNLTNKDTESFPGFISSVVDMFFVSQDIQVKNCYASQKNVSDHLPLVCELEI